MSDAKETNLRNEITIEVPYVDNEGKPGIKKYPIHFISQDIYKTYSALLTDITDAVTLGKRIEQITQDIGYSIAQQMKVVEKDDGTVEQVKKTFADAKAEVDALRKEYENTTARLN